MGDDPAGTKKQGSGKGNWGKTGLSELEDYPYNPTKPRRRTNSFSAAAGHSVLKTKFEAMDPEVIEFDEGLHGARVDAEEEAMAGADDEHMLEKMSSASSGGSVDTIEEEGAAVEKK